MALTHDQRQQIMSEMLVGNPVSVTGQGVEEFKAAFKDDMDTAEANGWVIDLPHDVEIGGDDAE
jgi:hypothetical protein